MSAAHLLREARLRAGLTQFELARIAETTQSAIARWEGGRVDPSHRTLVNLLIACGFELQVGLRPQDPDAATTLEHNLSLTPEERLDQLVQVVSFVEAGRAALREVDG